MKNLLFLALLSLSASADPIRVAVIDTGFDAMAHWASDPKYPVAPKVCPGEYYDFVAHPFGDPKVTAVEMKDNHGHGTHIAGLIAKNAGDADYCLVILKYYGVEDNNMINTLRALDKAIELKVDVINYSGGGTWASPEEKALVQKALDAGIIVVAAAGNEGSNINKHRFYPAAYDSREVVVGGVDGFGRRVPSSNFSDDKPGSTIVHKERGVDVLSILPGGQYGYMTGTSQATAIMTGKLVNRLHFMATDRYYQIIAARKVPKCPVQKAKGNTCNAAAHKPKH